MAEANTVAGGTNGADMAEALVVRIPVGAGGEEVPQGEERIRVCQSSLMAVKLVIEYVDAAIVLPHYCATDVAARCVDLLRLFNSRSASLVIGAGAMHTAGLKSITVKNLALAERGATLFHILASPQLLGRSLSGRVAPERPQLVLRDLAQVAKDLSRHADKVHEKWRAIVSDRAMLHCAQLLAVHGVKPGAATQGAVRYVTLFAERAGRSIPTGPTTPEATPPNAREPSAFACGLVKEPVVLARILGGYLSPSSLAPVLRGVILDVERHTADAFAALAAEGALPMAQMAVDAAHIRETLRGLLDPPAKHPPAAHAP